MIRIYTPKQWHSLFDCPCLIIDDQGLIWAADAYYKVLSGAPSGKIDYAAGKIYGKGLGYDLFEEPVAYLTHKNGVTEVQDAKEGIFSAPILYIKDNQIYTPENYHSIFDIPSGYIRGGTSGSDTSGGSSAGGYSGASGGAPVIGPMVLKLGAILLAAYCVLIGVANALPLWLSILLGIALMGGLIYMGWFSRDQSKQKVFRLVFWIELAWFGFVAILFLRIL